MEHVIDAKPRCCYLISLMIICCFSTMNLGSALSASSVAFIDLRFIKF